MTRTLLVVHHTPSPLTRELLEAVLAGARDPEITGVDVRSVPALGATVPDVLDADGFLFGTPANFGYMSGALKHFFDTVYYPCLDAVAGKPYGAWIHGNNDTVGAARGVETIASGWGLEKVFGTLHLADGGKAARERCYELGGTVSAGLSD
ncbi:NAD(P)H-dependent oxidoreductase [Rhodococcus ruber]|uniref:NAD(P)H-dependent oxidoreductase n=1 Tax=Rhodococcus ruber TaxID=1830 RepID=A0ABT4MEJ6_9NOCA|nr:NAD(P)H-dependent oxidoreductase [Rhodococcus ruber]MCZ4518480.1 NAD(P)H-dependent oxidoreductase [Rhodococcus ruber]